MTPPHLKNKPTPNPYLVPVKAGLGILTVIGLLWLTYWSWIWFVAHCVNVANEQGWIPS